MIAQDELRNAKFAEFETDAPDNIWHPEFKQEQLDLQKKQLQAMISASAPPDSQQQFVPEHYPQIPLAMSSLQSIPEDQLPQPIYDQSQYLQDDLPFMSQLQPSAAMLASQEDFLSRQQFQFEDQAQQHGPSVNIHPGADHRVAVDGPEIVFPAAGKISIPQQLQEIWDMPAAGTKTVPSLPVKEGSSSRVPAPMQSA
jgi:hypothetical protein